MPSGCSPISDSGPIPHSRPCLGEEEARAVARVVNSGHVAQGEKVRSFEKSLAQREGWADSVATGSGTDALFLALAALGAGPGDQVVIPAYVCTALAHAVLRTGAEPVLAEIDPRSFNMDPKDVEKRVHARTRAIIAPHLFGCPADMEALTSLGVPVIEDRAHFLGSAGKARGTLAMFSFYATKMLCAGEGGMVASDDPALLETIRDLREYDNKDDFRLRYNSRMTDMAAAMGLVQLARLDDFLDKRRNMAKIYTRALSGGNINLPEDRPGHAWFRYVIRTEKDSGPLIRELKGLGVCCARPVHLPLSRHLKREGYGITEKTWETALSVPLYPALGQEDRQRVVQALLEVLGKEKA